MGGLSFFCINFYLDFALDFFIAPSQKNPKTKQTNEQTADSEGKSATEC